MTDALADSVTDRSSCSRAGRRAARARSAPSSTRRCSSRRARAPARRRCSSTASSRSSTADGPDLPVPMRGDRRDHVHREGRGRAARPRPRASCEQRADDADATPTRARPLRRTRSTSSTTPRSARCTRSRSASSPSSRSRPGCRRASRSATRSRRCSRSRSGGAALVDELLDDPELESTVLVLLAAGVKLDASAHGRRDPRRQLGPARPHRRAAAAARARSRRRGSPSSTRVCATGDDCRRRRRQVLARLGELEEYRDRLRAAFDDAERIELLLAEKPSFKVGNTGSKKNWPDIDARARPHREARRAAQGDDRRGARRRDQARGRRVRGRTSTAARRRAPRVGRARVPRPARARAARCCAIPSTAPPVRARLRERYQRILIDEFQDTDPIQVEIAALLGSDDPADGDRPWRRDERRPRPAVLRRRSQAVDLPVPPGRHRDVPRGPRALRRPAPLLPHVQLPLDRAGARVDQPRVRPSSSSRTRRRSPSTSRSTAARRVRAEHGPRRRAARRRAASPTGLDGRRAARARGGRRRGRGRAPRSTRSGRSYDKATRRVAPGAARRRLHPVAGAHVARTSSNARSTTPGVPYRAETSSLVYGSREVRDLLMTLRAVDDSERRARAGDARCARRCSAAATTTSSRSTSSTAAGGTSRPPPPETLPGRSSGRRARCASSRELHRERIVGRRRASCSNASCASAHVLEVGVDCRALPRRRAPGALRGRPGARVRRRGRAARCATTSRGRRCRAPKARGSWRPCCPRPTTTRCGS